MSGAKIIEARLAALHEEILANTKLLANMEPPKQWRCWWRTKASVDICLKGGEVVDLISGVRFSTGPYPSKDVAEERAREVLDNNEDGRKALQYLGAFPHGERPA